MIANWPEEFAPHILARGKKYFEEGRVSRIIQYGNRIVAHVDGTEDYCVEIDLPGGVPDSWLCTCPYAVQGNCKHKAALLFAIAAGEYTFTGDPPEEDEDIPIRRAPSPWQDAIAQLPDNTLREILLHFATQDPDMQDYLVIHYLQGLPDELMAQWIANLQSYAKEMSSGYRYIPEEDVHYFMNGVRSALNERFLLLRKVGATMDAFYYLGAVFELASKWVYSDDAGYFGAFYDDCIELWDDLFYDATDNQQEQMRLWFWEHHAVFFAHANYGSDIDFLYYPWTYEQNIQSLEIIDGLFVKHHDRQTLELLIDCRLEIMDSLDCKEGEVWDFLKQHLDIDYARQLLLMKYDYYEESRVHIVPLLKQLKEMDADNLPRLIEDHVKLVQLYQKRAMFDAYEAERALLLTLCKEQLAAEIPGITDKPTARQFIICLHSLRSLKDKEVDQIIENLVDTLCSNPAIVRKGIIELINNAGYEWPKSYRFPD